MANSDNSLPVFLSWSHVIVVGRAWCSQELHEVCNEATGWFRRRTMRRITEVLRQRFQELAPPGCLPPLPPPASPSGADSPEEEAKEGRHARVSHGPTEGAAMPTADPRDRLAERAGMADGNGDGDWDGEGAVAAADSEDGEDAEAAIASAGVV
jgi:hypothetical protein